MDTLIEHSSLETAPINGCKLIDLNAAINIAAPGWIRHGLSVSLERLLAVDKLNRLYCNMPLQLQPAVFCQKSLEALNVNYSVTEQELTQIPQSGPLVMVANHPFGGLEGIILSEILLNFRSDVRILGNYLLNQIPELQKKIIPVDPFDPRKAACRNAVSMRKTIQWLKNGGALLAFPSGEVSHFSTKAARIADPPWSPHIARMITLSKARTVPVYIHGRNSVIFNLAGMLHPKLRTLLLCREMIRKSSATIKLSIGKPIQWQRLAALGSDSQAISYLRFSTNLLKHRTAKPFKPVVRPGIRFKNPSRQHPIIAPVHKVYLRSEILNLPQENLLATQKQLQIFVTTSFQSPFIMREIGRLREKSFRDVGEGTGQSIDLDEFDSYYQQLFLWNKETEEIVGAYRLGQTDLILNQNGAQKLYSAKLFDYSPEFYKQFNNALELGRSFIRTEYQKKFGCLAALWRGIGEFVVRNPHYRYLFGPVSISQDYHTISRNLIVEFLRRNKMAHEMTCLVKPRNAPKISSQIRHRFASDFSRCADIEDISVLISGIENDQKGVPTLIKHYLKLNGRFLAFNVDRDFANVIDGLIWVDLLKTDFRILGRFLGDCGVEKFKRYHFS